MQVRIHKSYREIIAISDSNLLGKTFEQGNAQLEVKEAFFKGEEKTKQEVIEIIKKMQAEDATFNIVGKESTQTALEAGIIQKQEIREIQGIPFTLVLL